MYMIVKNGKFTRLWPASGYDCNPPQLLHLANG
jgi:hypothetical protein